MLVEKIIKEEVRKFLKEMGSLPNTLASAGEFPSIEGQTDNMPSPAFSSNNETEGEDTHPGREVASDMRNAHIGTPLTHRAQQITKDPDPREKQALDAVGQSSNPRDKSATAAVALDGAGLDPTNPKDMAMVKRDFNKFKKVNDGF